LPEKIHLLILETEIETESGKENEVLSFVHFSGYQENPFKYLKKIFLILSSKKMKDERHFRIVSLSDTGSFI
jgi:hypothetical protein